MGFVIPMARRSSTKLDLYIALVSTTSLLCPPPESPICFKSPIAILAISPSRRPLAIICSGTAADR